MKLLDQVRHKLRLLHYSMRTEEAYLLWIEQFLRFSRQSHGDWVHPSQLGSDALNAFLTYLAVDRRVAASTQTQALCTANVYFLRTVRKFSKQETKETENFVFKDELLVISFSLLPLFPPVQYLVAAPPRCAILFLYKFCTSASLISNCPTSPPCAPSATRRGECLLLIDRLT